MSSPEKRVYEFGPFRLDPAEHVLLRDGEPVPLRPKEFAVLLALVGNHRHVLTKQELLEEVWPHQFIEEGNLNRQISTLRRVLGDTSDEPQYVQTVPKVGYRFVASVREIVSRGTEIIERELQGNSSEMVIESRTLSRIVTEEEDEPDVRELEPGFEPVAVLTTRKKEKRMVRIQWLALAIAGVLVISLTLALTYSRNLRRSNETNAAPLVRSLAVLPFKPIGVGDEDEYLGLGMADALITKLSSMREINTRPTSAVRKYSAKDQDPVAAGRELGVEAVIDGSVQRVGDQVRVTVQLVSVRDRAPVWAEKFDEPYTNIFAVQDRISEQVAQALRLSVSSAEKELLTKRYTENSEAYQLYQKGRYFWNKR
ncbi:MAG TPA: winged helix-turn-helix domain-containing protein, partial [Pyrinomonadaceae bacterium]|nr:winged helix-turn-helix domain-containing protein [Pyrinomonadaceae bacterium]